MFFVCRWKKTHLRHQKNKKQKELNAAIRPLIDELNMRPFQRLPGSRRSVFEALDRPAMQALPAYPYVFAEWKERRVAFDYHVDVEGHYYSVLHSLWVTPYGRASPRPPSRHSSAASALQRMRGRVNAAPIRQCRAHA